MMRRLLFILFAFIITSALFCGCEKTEIEPTATPEVLTPSPIPTETPFLRPEIYVMPEGNPAEHGFSQEKLDDIDAFIQSEVDGGFPGAVLMIVRDSEVVHLSSFGYAKKYDGFSLLSSPQLMQNDTMFDIASLTKVYGTMFAVMKLIDDGRFSLDDKVSYFLEGFSDGGKENITLRMLLNHSAGYGSDIRFFDSGTDYADVFYSTDRDKTISLLSKIELSYTPGEQRSYSDIEYMILCAVIEKVTGLRLDLYLRDYVYTPLGIQNQILFNPLIAGSPPELFAATERKGNTRDLTASFDNIREYTLQGEVHDEKTFYSMGGVSGHSGLFSDATAIAVLSQVLLSGGVYNGIQVISQDTAAAFLRIYDEQKYQLTLQNAKTNKYLADFVSSDALYHYGWTGTAVIIDPAYDMIIVLLTNKRHSPCVLDAFEGNDNYLTGQYTAIFEMIYNAIGD